MYDYEILLGNGLKVSAYLNANTWETDAEITEDDFEGGLDEVSYKTPEGDIVELGVCNLVFMGRNDGVTSFGLNPLDDLEKRQRELQQTLNDITDAVLEMSELVYGGE